MRTKLLSKGGGSSVVLLLAAATLTASVSCFYLVIIGPLHLDIPWPVFPALCTPLWAVFIYKAFKLAHMKLPILIVGLCELPVVLGYPAWFVVWVAAEVFGFGVHSGHPTDIHR